MTVGKRVVAGESGPFLLGARPGRGQIIQLVLGEGDVVLAPQVAVERVALELDYLPANSTPENKSEYYILQST